MDSMRNMSTSLPYATTRQRSENPADLLSEFKAAALSVTNLYKTAATTQARAVATGYQNALDDLLQFLDKEDLGLMDGEGWRVRQWATERLDKEGAATRQQQSGSSHSHTDDEEEATSKDEEKEQERSCSPEIIKKSQAADAPTSDEPQQIPVFEQSVPSGPFEFRSSHPYPRGSKDQAPIMDLDGARAPSPVIDSSSTADSPVRVQPRSSRTSRHTNHARQTTQRSTPFTLNVSSGAPGKRKIPYPDFFDISGISEGADRGGKRGRHT